MLQRTGVAPSARTTSATWSVPSVASMKQWARAPRRARTGAAKSARGHRPWRTNGADPSIEPRPCRQTSVDVFCRIDLAGYGRSPREFEAR